MHQTILILVSAENEQDAIDNAYQVAEKIIDYPCFDYFDQESFSPSNPDEPTECYPYEGSAAGADLVHEYLEYQKADFMAYITKVRTILANNSNDNLYEKDPDLFRNRCYVLGVSASPNIYFYDRYGNGLVKPEDIFEALKDTDDDSHKVWVKTVSVHI
jgi:hypothetical protein